MIGRILPVLWLALFASSHAATSNHCEGTVTLSAPTGTITDHVDSESDPLDRGFYRSNSECMWVINVPEADYITLDFIAFDTEYDFDFLYIYNGPEPTQGGLIAALSGVHPEALKYSRRIQTDSNVATLVFTSDALVVESGFVINYFASSCPDKCNGRGFCSPSDTCECNDGFAGSSCEVSTTPCPDGCGSNGYCTPSSTNITYHCACAPGWHGVKCDDPFCVDLQTIVSNSGSISDSAEEVRASRPSGQCQWHLQPEGPVAGRSMGMRFDKFYMTETSTLSIYDGPNTDAHLIGRFSGTALPNEVVGHSGHLFVHLSWTTPEDDSGLAVPPPEFKASYGVSTCLSCSGHGSCVFDNCHCDVGFTSGDCSVPYCEHDCHASVSGGTCETDTCNCNTGFTGTDCGICDGTGPECPPGCLPETVLSEPEGMFSSGAIDYVPESNCVFDISPSGSFSTIVLTPQTFDLVDDEAFVEIRDGIHTIALYTGTSLPRPLHIHAERATVIFTSSSSTSVGGGFTFKYKTVTCANDCNGNGICVADGVCKCDPGFTSSSDCAATECVDDCNADRAGGTCDTENNMCVCNPGHFGVDCKQRYCQGSTTLRSDSGEIIDHTSSNAYLAHSDCTWHIVPLTAGTPAVTFAFTQLQTEFANDYIEFIDDARATPTLYGRASGHFLYMPFNMPTDRPRLHFLSDGSEEYSGFRLDWSAVTECPSSCNNLGWCIRGKCHCYGGRAGPSCAESANFTVLKADIINSSNDIHLSIRDMKQFEMVYFKVPTGFSQTVRYVFYLTTPGRSEGDVMLMGSRDGFPSPTGLITPFNPLQVAHGLDVYPGDEWIIAIYAREDASGVQLRATLDLSGVSAATLPTEEEILERRAGFFSVFALLVGTVVLGVGCVVLYVFRTRDEAANLAANFNAASRSNDYRVEQRGERNN